MFRFKKVSIFGNPKLENFLFKVSFVLWKALKKGKL
jgi:hypothetical protein